MTFKWTSGAIMALALAGASCKTDDRSQEIHAMEERVAKLEAAAGATAPATGPSSSAPEDPVDRLEKRIDALEKEMGRTLKTIRIPLEQDKSGNELCAEKGHICLSVIDSAGSARYDENNNFCGHMTADCSSRVLKRAGCGVKLDYVLAPVQFHRSPGTKAQCDSSATESCAASPSGIIAICLE